MIKLLFAAIGTLILFSCSTPRYSYAPTRVNTPLFKEKKEIQLNGSISVLRGFDASGAYAISSHFGLMLNGSWRMDKNDGNGHPGELLPPEQIRYHRSALDLGAGWFTGIGSSSWRMEFFAGAGLGKFSISDIGSKIINDTPRPYSRDYSSKVQRFFLQPAFGANIGKSGQVIFFTRIQFQEYHNINTNYSENELTRYAIPGGSGTYYVFVEPGITFRFYIPSFPLIGFESNIVLSNPQNGYINSIPAHGSFGIHFRMLESQRKAAIIN